MSPLPSGTYVPIALWVSLACLPCQRRTRRVGASIEPVFTDEGELVGLEGVLTFESCGHRVPVGGIDVETLAGLIDDIEENSKDWEPDEEFDPDMVVEVED